MQRRLPTLWKPMSACWIQQRATIIVMIGRMMTIATVAATRAMETTTIVLDVEMMATRAAIINVAGVAVDAVVAVEEEEVVAVAVVEIVAPVVVACAVAVAVAAVEEEGIVVLTRHYKQYTQYY